MLEYLGLYTNISSIHDASSLGLVDEEPVSINGPSDQLFRSFVDGVDVC